MGLRAQELRTATTAKRRAGTKKTKVVRTATSRTSKKSAPCASSELPSPPTTAKRKVATK